MSSQSDSCLKSSFQLACRERPISKREDGRGGSDCYSPGQQLRPEQSGSAGSFTVIFLSSSDEVINDKGGRLGVISTDLQVANVPAQLMELLSRNAARLKFKTLTLSFPSGLVSASPHILQGGQQS